MQALVKTERERGALELRDVPKPEPDADEALIEVDYAGICGSDAGIYELEEIAEVMDMPTTIGHEYAGRVVEVGENVTNVEVGDRVVERIIRWCGECQQCQMGLHNICDNSSIAGVSEDGAFAEYLTAPAKGLHKIPEDLSSKEAALTEPLAVATRAVTHNADISPGTDVLVEGPGPIGMLSAQMARADGGNVTVTGIGPDAKYRLPLLRDMGFDAVNVGETPLEEVTADRTEGGFDVVIEATGHHSGVQGAADSVRKGGTVVLVGQSGTVEMDYTPLIRGEVDIQCSYCYTYDEFERSLDALASGQIDTSFIDDDYSMTDPDAAFEAVLDGETCKVVFDIGDLK